MKQKIPEHKSITTSTELAAVFRAVLQAEPEHSRDKEHFWICGLTTRNNIKYLELVTLGTLNATLVHPREVFRFAILQGSAAITLAHNHPSGDCEPSLDDISITKRLCDAGKILGIEVLDHLIIGNIGNKGWLSMREAGHV